MGNFSFRRPTTFASAFVLSLISATVTLVVMLVFDILTRDYWRQLSLDVIIIFTVFFGIMISGAILWGFATRKTGYLWA